MSETRQRSRVVSALAYTHALSARYELYRAIETEDVPGALHAVTLWAAWMDASAKEVER